MCKEFWKEKMKNMKLKKVNPHFLIKYWEQKALFEEDSIEYFEKYGKADGLYLKKCHVSLRESESELQYWRKKLEEEEKK